MFVLILNTTGKIGLCEPNTNLLYSDYYIFNSRLYKLNSNINTAFYFKVLIDENINYKYYFTERTFFTSGNHSIMVTNYPEISLAKSFWVSQCKFFYTLEIVSSILVL